MSKQKKNPFEPEKFPQPPLKHEGISKLKPKGISKLKPKGISKPKGV